MNVPTHIDAPLKDSSAPRAFTYESICKVLGIRPLPVPALNDKPRP